MDNYKKQQCHYSAVLLDFIVSAPSSISKKTTEVANIPTCSAEEEHLALEALLPTPLQA